MNTLEPAWIVPFLEYFTRFGFVVLAAHAAGISRQNVYKHRQEHDGFRARMDEAYEQFLDSCEAEAVRRARDGVEEPVIYQGQITYRWVNKRTRKPAKEGARGAIAIPVTVNKRSDMLLAKIIERHRPTQARVDIEVSGPAGGAIAVNQTTQGSIQVDVTQRLLAYREVFQEAAVRVVTEMGEGEADEN